MYVTKVRYQRSRKITVLTSEHCY